jgi:hypothetical protein
VGGRPRPPLLTLIFPNASTLAANDKRCTININLNRKGGGRGRPPHTHDFTYPDFSCAFMLIGHCNDLCAPHDLPETLENPAVDLLRRGRAGVHHRERGQRCWRHLDLFRGRAQFGHMLLWTMIPITVALIVVQEIAARMGAVTGKGLSDLIREEFGFRITFFMMIGLIIVNFRECGHGICGNRRQPRTIRPQQVLHRPGLRRHCLADRGQGAVQDGGEGISGRVVFYVTYILAGVLAKPAWLEALEATIVPPHKEMFLRQDYLYMVIGVVGTTIAPWMQFYLQASIVEKGVTRRQYNASRLDVVTGCVFTDIVAWFIIVACASTLYVHGYHNISDAKDAAQALPSLAGTMPTSYLPWDCSTHRCLPPRFCRSPPPTRFVRVWGLSREWENVR